MQIFINTPTGKTISLEVESSDLVDEVNTKVQNQEQVQLKTNQQRMFLGNTQLKYGLTLRDYEIKEGSVLHVAPRLPVIAREFKIHYGHHKRRFWLKGDQLTLASLRDRVSLLFAPPEGSIWYFEYADADGDLVRLTEDYELSDLLCLDAQDCLVRLQLVNNKRRFTCPSTPCVLTLTAAGVDDTPATKPGASHRALCDATDKQLAFGDWYHKMGSGVDLCAMAYSLLSDEEKMTFVAVDGPADLGVDAPQYDREAFRPFESDPSTSSIRRNLNPTKTSGGDDVGVCCSELSKVSDPLAVVRSQSHTDGDANKQDRSSLSQLQVEIVRGPSVESGSIYRVGDTLVPVWEVCNTMATGVWTDVRVKPATNNVFKAPAHGWEVPSLAAGEFGIVMLNLTVPKELSCTHDRKMVRAAFDLVDSSGNVFGDPLILSIGVEPCLPTHSSNDK